MSIKPDHWIRRMVESHGMIDPFEDADTLKTPTFPNDCSRLLPIVSYGINVWVCSGFIVSTAAAE